VTEIGERSLRQLEERKSVHHYWKMHLRGQTVPPDLEENAAEYYHSRGYKRARAIFSFLIDSFDNYAEGHNYLGLIDLDDNRLEDAARNFEKTIEVGRSLFPKQINRSRYWHNLDTRPYMRGLRNLCLTMNRLGRYDEALVLCDRLENECNDEITAAVYRSSAYLNTGLWKLAAVSAKYHHKIHTTESFIVSFAFFEMGKLEEARIHFLYAAFNNPRAARILVGIKGEHIKSKDVGAVQDHNSGVGLLQSLHGYFEKQAKASKVFFKELMNHDLVNQIFQKQRKLSEDDDYKKNPKWKDNFDQLHQMKEVDFAKATAKKIEIDE
jgi:tetratricopeptide (TPR) repeat protein